MFVRSSHSISTNTLSTPLCLYLFWGSVVVHTIDTLYRIYVHTLPGDVRDTYGYPGVKGLEDEFCTY